MAKVENRVPQNIERERHNLKFKDREPHIAVGEVVLIRGDEKNRGQWSIGVVER